MLIASPAGGDGSVNMEEYEEGSGRELFCYAFGVDRDGCEVLLPVLSSVIEESIYGWERLGRFLF